MSESAGPPPKDGAESAGAGTETGTASSGVSVRFLIAVVTAACLLPLNSTMIAVALPAIGSETATSPGTLTHWLITSYLLVSIMCQNPSGKIGDLWGHGRTLAAGRWLFAGGTLLAVALPVVEGIAAARVVMAVAGSLMAPTAMALLRLHIPGPRRARAFGLLYSAMATAAAIGPLLGGALVEFFGWPAIFLANLPVLMLSGVLQNIGRQNGAPQEAPPRAPGAKGASFDIAGSMLLALTLILAVFASRGSGAAALAGGVAAVACFWGFVRWEARAPSPLLDLGLFRDPVFSGASLVTGLQNIAMYGLLFLTPYLLMARLSLDAAASGAVLMVMTGGLVLLSPLGGRLADRLGAAPLSLGGALLAMVGTAALSLEGVWTTPVLPALCLGVAGAGLGLSTPAAQAAGISAAASHQSGMAAGTLSTLRYLGSVGGILLLGLFLNGGDGPLVNRAFWVFAGVLGLAAVAALLLRGDRGRTRGEAVSPPAP